MPSPFEILQAGDANTTNLFNSLNKTFEAAAQRQERGLLAKFEMASQVEQIRRNAVTEERLGKQFEFEKTMSLARFDIESAKTNLLMQSQLREIEMQDSKIKMDALESEWKISDELDRAKFRNSWDHDIFIKTQEAKLEALRGLKGTKIGDLSGLKKSAEDVKGAYDKAKRVLSVFGHDPVTGAVDPVDNGIGSDGKSTSGVFGAAIRSSEAKVFGKKPTELYRKIDTDRGTFYIPGVDTGPSSNERTDLTPSAIRSLGADISIKNGKIIGVKNSPTIYSDIVVDSIPEDLPSGNSAASSALFPQASNFPSTIPSEGFVPIGDESVEEAAFGNVNPSVPKTQKRIPQTAAEVSAFEQAAVAYFPPVEAKMMIAEMRKESPVFKGLKMGALKLAAGIRTYGVTPDGAVTINQYRDENFLANGGDINEWNDFATTLLQRNTYQANIEKNREFLNGVATGQTYERDMSSLKGEVERVEKQMFSDTFLYEQAAAKINKMAEIEVPQLPKVPEQTPHGFLKGRFGMTDEEINTPTGRAKVLQEEELLKTEDARTGTRRLLGEEEVTVKTKIGGLISEQMPEGTVIDKNSFKRLFDYGEPELKQAINQADVGKYYFPKNTQSLKSLLDNVIAFHSNPSTDPDAITTDELSGPASADVKHLAERKINEIKNNEKALNLLGYIVKDKEPELEYIPKGGGANRLVAEQFIKEALNDKTDDKYIRLIPYIKAAISISKAAK